MASVLLFIFVAQAISVAAVLFVLKKILEKRLLALAIKEFDFYSLTEGEQKPNEIFITTHKVLATSYRQRIEKIAHKKFGSMVKFIYHVQKELLGGIIIRVNQAIYNYSLRDRLKQSGFLR